MSLGKEGVIGVLGVGWEREEGQRRREDVENERTLKVCCHYNNQNLKNLLIFIFVDACICFSVIDRRLRIWYEAICFPMGLGFFFSKLEV